MLSTTVRRSIVGVFVVALAAGGYAVAVFGGGNVGSPTTKSARVPWAVVPCGTPTVHRVALSKAPGIYWHFNTARRSAIFKAVREDTALRQLMHGVGFRVADFGPWSDQTDTRLLGSVVMLRLTRPGRVSGTWPVLKSLNSAHYAQRCLKYAALGVREIEVSISLAPERVVGIQPLESEGVAPASGAS